MNIEQYRDFCLSLKGVTEETPFGPETLVFKVMGKIFSLTGIEEFASINLKCDPEKAVLLREQYEGVQPGYHMSKKHWNTIITELIQDKLILQWTKESYDLVVSGLPKKIQAELL